MTTRMKFCIKAATTLHDRDVSQLTDKIEAYMRAGMDAPGAEQAAVNDMLAAVASERTELAGLLREQHADKFDLLTNPTVQGLREKEAAAKKAADAEKAEQKRLADKAKADAEVGEFTLTGSNRAADVGAAGGQQPMFSINAHQTETPAFKKWFGDSKVVDENGKPLVVYHGTTNDFHTFDRSRANAESDMGAGFYFSNTPEDVAHNYAGEGPDLTNKIEQRAERLQQKFEDTAPITMDEAREMARKELSEHGGATMPAYLSLKNPLEIGGKKDTFLSYEQAYDEETDDYGEETGSLVDVLMALQGLEGQFQDMDYSKITENLSNAMADGGIHASELLPLLKKSEGLIYATDDNGNLASTEIIRQALEEASFDGIIDHTVDEKFGSGVARRIKGGKVMKGMHEETVHYIAFEPTQIKSATGNKGTFDPTNPNISADFSGEGIPTGEAIERSAVTENKSLTSVQRFLNEKVPRYEHLKLTPLPALTKPTEKSSALTQERYAAQEIAKAMGVKLTYFESSQPNFANGLSPHDDRTQVFINESAVNPVMAVMGHEALHSMRGQNPALYDKLVDRLSTVLKDPGAYGRHLNERYKALGIAELSKDKGLEELVANIVGDNFTDPMFWRQMAKEQPSLFQRVLSAVRDFLNGVLAKLKNERPYGTDKYLTDIKAARDAVVATMSEFARTKGHMAYDTQAEAALAFSDNTEPFYSELARQVATARMNAAPASGWLEWLKGVQNKGVKADEIAWTGIEDWLKLRADQHEAVVRRYGTHDRIVNEKGEITGKSLTSDPKIKREEVLDYLKANGVQVTETVLGDTPHEEFKTVRAAQDFLMELHSQSRSEMIEDYGYSDERDYIDAANEAFINMHPDSAVPTKYHQYTLPGGQNYQELLLTLPTKPAKSPKLQKLLNDYERLTANYTESDNERLGDLSDAIQAEKERLRNEDKAGWYKSSHWDQTNILAHVRFNERTDADGKRVLFIEEIQSDWAQEGKKKGFAPEPTPPAEMDRLRAELADLKEKRRSMVAADRAAGREQVNPETEAVLDQEMALQARINGEARSIESKTPSAPFVTKTDAWVALAVKRMVKYAADNGFDRVAFVNGEQSADRYDLSKQISAIEYERGDDDTFELVAKGLDGKEVLNEDGISIERVEELIGKEMAKKIANGDGDLNNLGGWGVYSEGERIFEAKDKATAQEYADVYSGTASVKPFSDGYRDWRTLSGIDLKVGGEGMKAFYDKIVPKVVKDTIKKIGGDGLMPVRINSGSVEAATGKDAGPRYDYSVADNGTFNVEDFGAESRMSSEPVFVSNHPTREEAAATVDRLNGENTTTQLGFDITPKMREATAAGLPMFSIAPKVLPPEEGWARAFQRKFQDSYNRFTVVKNWAEEHGIKIAANSDVWKAVGRMHGRIATRVEDFREKRIKPAVQAIQKAGFTMEQVAEFLHAQHAEERNKQIESIDPKTKDGSGMSTVKANFILSKADPKLVTLANDFRSITEDTKNILLKAGIINQDMVDAWEKAYQHYVPLKGGDEDPAGKTGTGKGMNVAGKQKRALGHDERTEHIIENIMRDHERAISLAEKNRVGHSLLGFISDLNNPDLATIGQPEKRKVLVKGENYEVREQNGQRIGIFDTLNGANAFIAHSQAHGLLAAFGSPLTIHPVKGDPSVAYMASRQLADNEVNVYVDGHDVRIQLNDPLMAQAYTHGGVERLNSLMAVNRDINRFLSQAYTGKNPAFLAKNVIRDFSTGTINVTANYGAKVTARAVASYPKAFATLIRYSVTGKETPSIKAYRAAGGSMGAAYLSDIDRLSKNVQNAFDDYRGVIATAKGSGAKAAIRAASRKVVGSILSVFEHLNAAGESAFRLAVFESVRTTPGYTDADAATAAKEATVNFNRRGEKGPEMGALYLFFNPIVQGTATAFDALLHGKHKAQGWALAAALPAVAYALASLQWGGGDDDDDTWLSIPDNKKDKNFIIRTGEKSYITIPTPDGIYGLLATLGNSLYALQKGRDVDKVSLNLASNLFSQLSPVGNPIADKLEMKGLIELTPGAIGGELMRDVARLAVNRSSFGSEIVPDSPFDPSKPDNQRMNRATKGSWADKITSKINTLTGGTQALAGNVDVSPETLKFWVNALFGGSGTFLADTAALGANQVRKLADPTDPDRAALNPETREIPIVRDFKREETVGDLRRRFWDAVKDVKETEADLHRTQKAQDEVGEQKVWDDRGELIALADFTKAQTALVKIQRDAVDAIMADPDTSLAFKRARVKELETEEGEIYRAYVRDFTAQHLDGVKQRKADALKAKETAK